MHGYKEEMVDNIIRQAYRKINNDNDKEKYKNINKLIWNGFNGKRQVT